MTKHAWMLYAFTILVFGGCSGNSPYLVKKQSIGHDYTLTVDAAKRSIIFDRQGKFCSEPSPDVMGTLFSHLIAEMAAKGSAKQVDVEGELRGMLNSITSTGVHELFQRSQGVQVLRDGLYRLCEGHLNTAISKEEYREGLLNLITTLNYVVPLELCTKISSLRLITEETSTSQTGSVSATNQPASPGNSNTAAPKLVKTTTERAIPEKLIFQCLASSVDFAKAVTYVAPAFSGSATTSGHPVSLNTVPASPVTQ